MTSAGTKGGKLQFLLYMKFQNSSLIGLSKNLVFVLFIKKKNTNYPVS